MQIIGVNSGTSVDSLDIAVFNVSKNKISFLVGQSFKYPTILSDEIRGLGPNSSILQVDNISIKLGEFVGRKINNLLKSMNKGSNFDLSLAIDSNFLGSLAISGSASCTSKFSKLSAAVFNLAINVEYSN